MGKFSSTDAGKEEDQDFEEEYGEEEEGVDMTKDEVRYGSHTPRNRWSPAVWISKFGDNRPLNAGQHAHRWTSTRS